MAVWRCTTGGMVLLIFFALGFASLGRKDEILYVGLPDEAAGLIARYVTDEEGHGQTIQATQFLPYTLYDCCASATQYAMGSGRLDMAVMCPEAAQALVSKDQRYEIVGPVMKNSDILVTQSGILPKEIAVAVSQKRDFQYRLVNYHLGLRGRPVPMLHSAVPFAYTRGVVHGAVVDITKAFKLQGRFSPAADQGCGDMVTSVLVVKKTLQDKQHYHRFMSRYAKAVQKMQNRVALLNLLKTYVSDHMTMGDVETWQKMNVQFTHPLNRRRQR